MFRFLRHTMHPARYHGRLRGQRSPFFEGWYYKLVDRSGKHRFAIIPGVFWSSRPHAFIQVLDGAGGASRYHDYPVDLFWAAEDRFDVHVGGNRFSHDQITLSINQPEQEVYGTLRFGGLIPWPVTPLAPGIMGWFAWMPFMECYHGVVSLDHAIYGSLTIDGREIDFTGGRGYIEKDWGRSFPEAWIWFQSNHFEQSGTSLTGSIAIIPWMRTAFPGFIIGLWHDQHLYRFATYTGAKIERLEVMEHAIDWSVGDDNYRLEMHIAQGPDSQFGLLKGPDTVEMGKRVAESMSATVAVHLTSRRDGRTVFKGSGRYTGVEVHEAQARLLKII